MSPAPPARILHVVDTLEFGGLERVVSDLAIAQAAQGHRVQVFSLTRTDGFRSMLENAGVPVVVGAKRGTLDLRLLSTLRRTVSAGGMQVVHTHNFVPSYYAALATRGMARGPALVNTCHNMGTRLSNRRLDWLYRWSLRHTARIALVGRQVRDRLVDMGVVDPDKADVVLNGVPVAAMAPRGRDIARDRLGIAPDALLVGCVGRLVPLKNHEMLVDALQGLAARHPTLRAVIIGEGPLQGALQSRLAASGLEERIRLTGARSDVHALLPGLDVFVLPSRTEGLSIALLEACAAGLAIVATDVGGNREIIVDGATGRLVPSEDAAALQQQLDLLLQDAPERQRLGTAARDWVRQHGSVDAMRQNYDAVYAQAQATRR